MVRRVETTVPTDGKLHGHAHGTTRRSGEEPSTGGLAAVGPRVAGTAGAG